MILIFCWVLINLTYTIESKDYVYILNSNEINIIQTSPLLVYANQKILEFMSWKAKVLDTLVLSQINNKLEILLLCAIFYTKSFI